MSNKRKRPKIAVFIRDVPSFGNAPIVARLLNNLAKEDVHPVFCYSVVELLKDKRNVKKMRHLSASFAKPNSNKTREDANHIVRGCDVLLRHLFERAIRSSPELIVIDYLSETFVDVRRMTKITKKLNYKVIFLKANLNEEDAIHDAVSYITSHIKYQNHAEIWCQREADKWWHEIDKIYLNDQNNSSSSQSVQFSPFLHKVPSSTSTRNCQHNLLADKNNWVMKYTECITELAERYYCKLEELASMLSGDLENYISWIENNVNERTDLKSTSFEDSVEDSPSTGSDFTLIVVDDFHYRRPGLTRLFDLIVERILQQDFSFHAIPIGHIVTMPKFQVLFDWYCVRSDMDVMDTYSYLFLDTFYSIYGKEKIVVLDNIHEGIVMSSYYISKAVEKNWEVLVVKRDKFWPPKDEEIVGKVMERLKDKYTTNNHSETNNRKNNSRINNAFGDHAILHGL